MNLEKLKRIKIAKIFGIDIEIHWSWFFILIYAAWMLAGKYFSKVVPGQSSIAYWTCGVITALVLFASVLIHELVHSRVAQLFKIRIQRITLMILGGMAQMESMGKRPKEEFLIAIAGPLSSIVLAIIFRLAAVFLHTNIKLIGAMLFYLSFLNIALAVFNLLPAYPMDGGRIFKTILWALTKNQLKATKIAGIVGQIFGALMIFCGILGWGFMLIFIGYLLILFAPAEYRLLLRQQRMNQLKARDVMKGVPEVWLPKDMSKEITCGQDESLIVVLEKMKNSGFSIVYVINDNKIVGMITK